MSDYSIPAALRHLVSGPRRPRQAVREAVDARLSEFNRLGLVAFAGGAVGIFSVQVREVFERHLGESDENELGALIISWLVAVLIASAAHYFTGSVFVAGVLSVLRVPNWTFVNVRSAWAMADWIAKVPILLLLVVDSFLPPMWRPAAWYDPVMLAMAGVDAIYRMFCIAETTGASLLQALVAALVAGLALYMLAGFLSDRFNILLASF